MTAGRIALAVLAALVVLTGCDSAKDASFQGWVEAELIFVGPDEAGRIETLTVREGDRVDLRQLLFTLDTELQAADVAMQEAAVKNAQLAFDRAQQLLSRQAGIRSTGAQTCTGWARRSITCSRDDLRSTGRVMRRRLQGS